jgi:nitroreductase
MALPEFDLASQQSIPFDGKFLRPGALVDAPAPHMPLLDAVCTRRTSRAYADRPVDRATFEWLIRHAMEAPTACNEQQWKIVLLEDPAVLRDLYERGSASFLLHVRQAFLLCYNRRTDNRHWLDHVQSGAAFIATFQLLAHSVGVGSCWIGHLPDKGEVRRRFAVHRAYEPIALVSYGYYRDRVKMLPRKHDVAHVIMEGRFAPERLRLQPARATLARTIGRRFYYWMPAFLRRRLRERTKPFEKKFYYETFD